MLSANAKWKTANLCNIMAWIVLLFGLVSAALIWFALDGNGISTCLLLCLTGFGVLKGISAIIGSVTAIGIKTGALKDDIPEDAQYVEDAPAEKKENTSNPQ